MVLSARTCNLAITFLTTSLVLGTVLHGGEAAAQPRTKFTVQNRNNMQMTLTNNGGFAYATWYWSTLTTDPFTGNRFATLHYPRGSDIRYQMNGTLILGAVIEGDTVVTTGFSEAHSEAGVLGDFVYRSVDHNHPRFDPEAKSQLDIICQYADTFGVYTTPDLRGHSSLGIKVTQTSMAWTGDNIDDFIIFDYEIQNIGDHHLEDMYVGFLAHGGVNYVGEFDLTMTQLDDVIGFLHTYPAQDGCRTTDTLNIAYSMDADGDPSGAYWTKYSPRAVAGIHILGVPSDHWRVNFNWGAGLGLFGGPRWGPRRAPAPNVDYRPNLPAPGGFMDDVELYYYLRNPEIDYDQLLVTLNFTYSGWLPPPASATSFALRATPDYIISAGPFDIQPGQTESVAMAVVGGENVHVNPWDFGLRYKTYSPWPYRYIETLDFSELAKNARWAEYIYDIPGVDTDSDGYAGEYMVCDDEIYYYKGDGIPDMRADGPPQTPMLRVIPSTGKLIIRWNGYYSETVPDIFTGLKDFEGYRVWVGLDDRRSSLSLLSVYDGENYDRFRLNQKRDSTWEWVNEDVPFTLDELLTMYGQTFRPLKYTRLNPFHAGDTLYSFEAHSYNASSLCCNDRIHKVYPNAPDPGADPSLWTEDDLTYDYTEPLPKYYEYEYIHDSLLTTVPYWIAVTAYDFGFSGGNIPSKESDPLANLTTELAQTPVDTVALYDLDVFVYPNPWRWDGRYSQRGYENRDGTEIPARSRRIHFSNLPKVCKIYIYSLDGDLVRQLDHNYPDGGPGSMHATWDMITRNTQAAVSGLYYWVVESASRTQIGKLVILK